MNNPFKVSHTFFGEGADHATTLIDYIPNDIEEEVHYEKITVFGSVSNKFNEHDAAIEDSKAFGHKVADILNANWEVTND